MPTRRRVPCQGRGLRGKHHRGGWSPRYEIHWIYSNNVEGTIRQSQGEPEAREQTAPHRALQVHLATEENRHYPPGEVANPPAGAGVLNKQQMLQPLPHKEVTDRHSKRGHLAELKIKDCIKVPPPIETSGIELRTYVALLTLGISHRV